jgi:hypothetical protein
MQIAPPIVYRYRRPKLITEADEPIVVPYYYLSLLQKPVLMLVLLSWLLRLVVAPTLASQESANITAWSGNILFIILSPVYLYYSHRGLCQLTGTPSLNPLFYTIIRVWANTLTGGFYGAWYYQGDHDRRALSANYAEANYTEEPEEED